jgi:hypothetical protein
VSESRGAGECKGTDRRGEISDSDCMGLSVEERR